MTEHVTDDLELYAVGALLAPEADRVVAHLAACPACRSQLEELHGVINVLPDMVPPREPPAALRERILSAAAADEAVARPTPPTGKTSRRIRPTRGWIGRGVLAAGVVLLLALDLGSLEQLRAAEADRAQAAQIADKVAYGGRNWYMAGLDQWKGSGGTLFAPGKTELSPFVVFHDIRPLSSGAVYAVWLIDADGHWIRGANFRPDGRSVQSVDLTVPVDAFFQCAVTIEMATEGKRAGPVVMQSRIAPGQ